MRTFIAFEITLHVIAILITICQLSSSEYPRKKTVTLGADAANLITYIAVLAWACWLLWGQQR